MEVYIGPKGDEIDRIKRTIETVLDGLDTESFVDIIHRIGRRADEDPAPLISPGLDAKVARICVGVVRMLLEVRFLERGA